MTYFLLMLLCLLTQTVYASEANNSQLYQSYYEKKPNGEYTMMVKEVKRTEDTSEVIFELGAHAPHIPPLYSSLFIMCATYDIAKERGFKQIVDLKEGGALVGFSNLSPAETVSHFQRYNNTLTEKDVMSISDISIVCENPDSSVTKEYYTPVR